MMQLSGLKFNWIWWIIKVWERFRGGLDKGWIWLQSKFSIINTFLSSLGSAGVPGVDAISEIKDAYEAAKK